MWGEIFKDIALTVGKNLIKGKKCIIYDMRNIYSPMKIKNQGFKYYSIGR